MPDVRLQWKFVALCSLCILCEYRASGNFCDPSVVNLISEQGVKEGFTIFLKTRWLLYAW